MKIKFLGATDGVTGSKHLLLTSKGKQVLLDCGLFQGRGRDTDGLNRALDLDPSKIEAVILSHAHIDHSGNLPNLMKNGFNGKIYCTPATLDVCRLLLMDSAHIHENDIYYINKRRSRKKLPPLSPLYTAKDAEKCLKLFKEVPFNSEFRVNDELSFNFTEAGHIIGAAVVNVTFFERDKKIKLTFSGDVGRYTDPLLKAPKEFPQADYIICESTYGNRLHEKLADSEEKLLKIIIKTCLEKKGKLIIPAFSLGRTQELLFALDKLENKNLLPRIKIFVDSPLSAGATKVVLEHKDSFNPDVQKYLKSDSNPFEFENLKYVQDSDESKALNETSEPCIIISASGMCEAGRVKHHIKNSIGNERNTIVITGYCAPNTLGERLVSGEKQVYIFGELYDVKAKVESILSFSAHADQEELIKFLSCQDKTKVKSVFLVHGESQAKVEFQEKLKIVGYENVEVPSKNEIYILH